MKPWTNKSLGLGIIGLFLVGLGTSLCFLWPTFFHQIVQKGLALSPISNSFEIWKDTSKLPPMRMNIYLFNWTNPEELGVRGKKPHFVQVGPYCFTEIRQKINITFHPNNKTVSYFQRKIWHFDAEHTNGSLNDTITHLNMVAVSAAHKIRYWDYGFQTSLSLLLTTSRVYVVKTVDELLFTGYADSLLRMGKMMISDSDIPAYDRFGWFYTRNGSTMEGHMNMETGEDDISQLGKLRKWNYKDTTKYYKSPCNIVEGSAGEFWPPGRTKDDITFFSADLCRPLIYEYDRTVYHMDIEGYRYIMDKKTLGNDTRKRYPHEQAKFFEPTTTTEDFFAAEHSAEDMGVSTTTENTYSDEKSSENTDDFPDDDPDIVNVGHCYCNGECPPSGLINITECRYGAPGFISLPHFYKADPNLLDQIEGLNPNEEDHGFFITLEPTTGIPLEVAARLQVNVLMQPSKMVSLFNDVPKIYMPVFWFSVKVGITEEMAISLKQLLLLPTIMLSTGVIMGVIGFCLIGAVVFLYLTKKHISPMDLATEKPIHDAPEQKAEMMYMDKIAPNEDTNARSDRQLYAKLY